MSKKNKTWQTNEDGEQVMSLTGHLRELRNRIIVCLGSLAIFFVICFAKAEMVVNELSAMGLNNGYTFVYLSPQELLLQYMRIGIIGSLILSIPILVYEVYAFIAPGLDKREKPFLALALIFGQVFFVLGALFAHKISMPFMLGFLIKLNMTNYITASISIESYLTFVITVYLIFGIVFEMPVISAILTKFNMLKSIWLKKARSISVIACFLLAALITPPDVVSQVMVAIPMMILYQFSIYVCIFIEKFNRKKEMEEELD